MSALRNLLAAIMLIASAAAAHAAPQWLTLPATPTLPSAAQSGLAPVNGIKIWYASFGQGEPVLLIHGAVSYTHLTLPTKRIV